MQAFRFQSTASLADSTCNTMRNPAGLMMQQLLFTKCNYRLLYIKIYATSTLPQCSLANENRNALQPMKRNVILNLKNFKS